MLNAASLPGRTQYLIKTNEPKKDNNPLTQNDLLSVGYMAGRCGVNLENPNEDTLMISDKNGTYVNINSCTSALFEDKLNASGIKFNKLA